MIKILSYLPLYLTVVFLSYSTLPVQAQEDLRKEDTFFQNKLTAYQDWLTYINLHEVLNIDTLQVEREHITLHLKVPNKMLWIAAKNAFEQHYQSDLRIKLFEKLAFQMEVGRDSVAVSIRSAKNDHFVDIGIKNKQLKISEPSTKGLLTNTIKISLPTTLMTEKDTITGSIEKVKETIKAYLDSRFKEKAAWSWTESKCDFIEEEAHILSIEVSNIKKEILYDFAIGYYEFIHLDIKIEEETNALVLQYDLQGKYGSGIFLAPRRSDYHDMETKYPDYLNRYNRLLKSQLHKLFTQL